MMGLNHFMMKHAISKKNNIPFILFVSTEPVGKYGYMSWEN